MKITLLALVVLALTTCGNGQSQNNNPADPGSAAAEASVAQEPQTAQAGGTITRGDKTATFANEHILEGGYAWGGVFIQEDDDGKEVTVSWEGPMAKDPTDY